MPGMFPEIGTSSAGSNPGATNWQQQLSALVALAAGADTLLFTQAAPVAGTYVVEAVLTIIDGAAISTISAAIQVAGTTVATASTQTVASGWGELIVRAIVTLNGSQNVTVRALSSATSTLENTSASGSANYTGNFATTFNGFRIN